jgi:hypothetical protein
VDRGTFVALARSGAAKVASTQWTRGPWCEGAGTPASSRKAGPRLQIRDCRIRAHRDRGIDSAGRSHRRSTRGDPPWSTSGSLRSSRCWNCFLPVLRRHCRRLPTGRPSPQYLLEHRRSHSKCEQARLLRPLFSPDSLDDCAGSMVSPLAFEGTFEESPSLPREQAQMEASIATEQENAMMKLCSSFFMDRNLQSRQP